MLDLYFVEGAITATVVGLQLLAFVATARAARRLTTLFPAEVAVVKLTRDAPADPSPDWSSTVRVQLVTPAGVRPATAALLQTTNRLFASARRDQPLFDLAAGVAHRLSDRLEQEATSSANLPVFLGLMGTFAGVITGLAQMATRTGLTESAIHLLLGGVLVAMIGSLAGVFLMIVAHAIVLPQARRAGGTRMDAFLAAVQAALAPAPALGIVPLPTQRPAPAATPAPTPPPTPSPAAASQRLADAAFEALTKALTGFNRDFTVQVGRFHESVGTLSQSLQTQAGWLQTLERLDIGRVIQLNLQLLAASQGVLERFATLGDSLQTLKRSTDGIGEVTQRVGQLMDRITRFEESVNALGGRIAADRSLTAQTVALIGTQLDAIRARTDLVQQYVALEDTRVETIVKEHRQQIEALAGRASQTIDRIGEEIAAEVSRATEPARVHSLMDDVAHLPKLLDASRRAAEEGLTELRRTREAQDASLGELRRMSAAVTRASGRGFWTTTRRATSRLFGWTRETGDAGQV